MKLDLPEEILSPIAENISIALQPYLLKKIEIKSNALFGHGSPVTSIAITSDSKQIISGSDDRTIRIWDIQTSRELNILRGHVDTVTSIAVISDNKQIISGSLDKTIRIWDIESFIRIHKELERTSLDKHYFYMHYLLHKHLLTLIVLILVLL